MQINTIFNSVLSSLAVLLVSKTVTAGVVSANAMGCREASKANEGVDITFYSYKHKSLLSQQKDFFSKLYATEKLHFIPSYKEELSVFDQAVSSEVPEMGEIYGYETTFTNFTALITGYYFAEETGEHTFEFFATKGGASLRFGAGVESCSGIVENDITDKFAIKTLGATGSEESVRFTTYLEKGLAYPIELIVNNWKGDIFFDPSLSVPDDWTYNLEGSMFSQIKKTTRA